MVIEYAGEVIRRVSVCVCVCLFVFVFVFVFVPPSAVMCARVWGACLCLNP